MTANADDYALVHGWEQDFQEHYINVLKERVQLAELRGTAGEIVEAVTILRAFGEMLEAKKKYLGRRLEQHLLDGPESAAESFRQS